MPYDCLYSVQKTNIYTRQGGSRESGTLGGTLPGEMICFLTPRRILGGEVTCCLDYDEFISEYKDVSLVVPFVVQNFCGRHILLKRNGLNADWKTHHLNSRQLTKNAKTFRAYISTQTHFG